MTRAMLVTVLYNLENPEKTDAQNTFSDVKNGEWYTNAVIWAKENGIVNGISETEFAPNKKITREQLVTVMYRYAKLKRTNMNSLSELSDFTDSDEIYDYARYTNPNYLLIDIDKELDQSNIVDNNSNLNFVL